MLGLQRIKSLFVLRNQSNSLDQSVFHSPDQMPGYLMYERGL